jgi:hypothetical protein
MWVGVLNPWCGVGGGMKIAGKRRFWIVVDISYIQISGTSVCVENPIRIRITPAPICSCFDASRHGVYEDAFGLFCNIYH